MSIDREEAEMKWQQYQVDVPAGTRGRLAVERFTVTAADSKRDAMYAAIHGDRRFVPPGTYTRLVTLNSFYDPIMSDTPDEIRDHYQPIQRAVGKCLITGLGLGVVANGMLLNKNVERVTCIEISSDVIELVAPHWKGRWGDRFEVICADALQWKPPKGSVFDVVWHDIWPGICSENLAEMATLHRRYAKRCGWQGSWAKELCQLARRRGGCG